MTKPSATLLTLLRQVKQPTRAQHVLIEKEASFSLFHHWLAFTGLLLFAAFLLWQHGVWSALANADPTGITFIIIAIFIGSTLWCGARARVLCREASDLDNWRIKGQEACESQTNKGAVHTYLAQSVRQQIHGSQSAAPEHSVDILAEGLHGPSELAWWVNGVQIKLGLLGKVIGFSILALQIARMESFDPSQSQTLLRNLTGGLGIALLTTAVGLVANILLGLQLVRIDRYADRLLADTLAYAGRNTQRIDGQSVSTPQERAN